MSAKSWMTTSGKVFSLDHLPTERVVLYFYPKDNTSGCTLEAKQFSALLPEFQKLGVTVYGVSRDSLKSHESFREKQSLSVELISDPEESLCRHFDVIKEKNMYGKKVLGIERSTFVLNRKGEVLKEWRRVKADGHSAEVLEWLKSGDEQKKNLNLEVQKPTEGEKRSPGKVSLSKKTAVSSKRLNKGKNYSKEKKKVVLLKKSSPQATRPFKAKKKSQISFKR